MDHREIVSHKYSEFYNLLQPRQKTSWLTRNSEIPGQVLNLKFPDLTQI